MIRVFPLGKADLMDFLPMLPAYLFTRTAAVFGAQIDGVNCGAVCLDIMGERASIRWLWVQPDRRGRGVGSALVRQACAAAFFKMHHSIAMVTVSYPHDADWAPVIERMLCGQGFLTKAHAYYRFRLSRADLIGAPFLSPQANVDWRGSILPLSAMSSIQKNEIRAVYEKDRNYLASRAGLMQADDELSHVLMLQGRPAGLTLVRSTAPGAYQLDLFSIQRGCVTGGLALLRSTAQAALQKGLREFTFDCVEVSAQRLARKLLGQPGERGMLCQAQLNRGLFRKDRDNG